MSQVTTILVYDTYNIRKRRTLPQHGNLTNVELALRLLKFLSILDKAESIERVLNNVTT